MSDLPQQNTIDQYISDGVETIYNYTYYIPDEESIAVYVTLSGQQHDEVADLQVYGVDYSVQDAGVVEGGTITFLGGHIPPDDATITLSRALPYALDTEFAQIRNFSGQTLDNAFQETELQIQQLASSFDERGLKYHVNQYLPDPDQTNTPPETFLPRLAVERDIWMRVGDRIEAVQLEENPDVSALRAELALNDSFSTAGANLVGYFDPSQTDHTTTVNAKLNMLPDGYKIGLDLNCLSGLLAIAPGLCAARVNDAPGPVFLRIPLSYAKYADQSYTAGGAGGAVVNFNPSTYTGWAYVFIIGNSTSGIACDVCIASSISLSGIIPAPYDSYRRIGCIYYNGSGPTEFEMTDGVFTPSASVGTNNGALFYTSSNFGPLATGASFNFTQDIASASTPLPGLPAAPKIKIPFEITIFGQDATPANQPQVSGYLKSAGATLSNGLTYFRMHANADSTSPSFNNTYLNPAIRSFGGAPRLFNIWIQVDSAGASGVDGAVIVTAYQFIDLFNDF